MPITNYFITGMPKTGKTTLLHRIIEKLRERGLRVGGFISPEKKVHGTRTGFFVQGIETGKTGRLAGTDATGPKVSKYYVDIRSFEEIALPALEKAEKYDVLIIDEIGPMELKSRKFVERLDQILESDTHVIASLHNAFIGKFGAYGQIVRITPDNRETITVRLMNALKELGEEKKPAARKKKAAAKAPKKKPARPARKKEKKKKAKKGKAKPKKEKKEEKAKEPQKKEKKKKAGVVGQIADFFGF